MDKKEWRKKNKWKRGLSRKLVENISSFNPYVVEFTITYPDFISCVIKTDHGEAEGIAICSWLDEPSWDEKRGRNIAAGRAVKALKNRSDSEHIRSWSDGFPQTWFIRQANKLNKLYYLLGWKSVYMGGIN